MTNFPNILTGLTCLLEDNKMKAMTGANYTEFAHLIIDKPLVSDRIDEYVEAGKSYSVFLKHYITNSSLGYMVIVDGLVVDQDEIIKPNTEIRCVPQICGG